VYLLYLTFLWCSRLVILFICNCKCLQCYFINSFDVLDVGCQLSLSWYAYWFCFFLVYLLYFQCEIHELLALVYYDSLQNVVPFYDQRSVLPSKDAAWMAFCENSMKHFKKAFALQYVLLTCVLFSALILVLWRLWTNFVHFQARLVACILLG
jgi:hypothetical protein